jgi:hypothetical protein
VAALAELGAFLAAVWDVTVAALLLRPDAVALAAAQSRAVILAIASAGGVSLMLGQSAVLFVNRLSPRRFALSVAVNAAIFVVGRAIWAVAIWVSARVVVDADAPIAAVVRSVGLGCAPFLFGILIFLPYAGPLIARVLSVWSLLIVLSAVRSVLDAGFLQALICVGLGWLLVLIAGNMVARSVVRMRDWIQLRAAGRTRLLTIEEALTSITEDPYRSGAADGRR